MALGAGSTFFFISLFLAPTTEVAHAQSTTDGKLMLVMLGKQLFSDKTLSEPAGQACISCHDPKAGFSFPDSDINQNLGVAPGVVSGRFGFRKVPTNSYVTFLPEGPPTLQGVEQVYVGGLFMDGRAVNAVAQAKQPFVNPNEMNNLLHNLASPEMVVDKIKNGPSGALFRRVYGNNVFSKPVSEVYDLMAQAIAQYEASPDVSPFTSKYDAWLEGKAQLTPQELTGLRLATGRLNGRPNGIPFPVNAHCMDCHGISSDLSISRDIWSNACYVNLGVPRNPNNPFYTMTDKVSNPNGYNPYGREFIDYGLGEFMYPVMGKPRGNLAEGDPLNIDGTFRAPTLRNVGKRPYPGFVKAYFHNGVFKSLKEVVHFYNTRNLTTEPGEVIDFTLPDPYAVLKGTPLWGRPEWPRVNTLNNPKGNAGGEDEGQGEGDMFEAEIGNLTLTAEQEDAIVAFLETLSDGYFKR